jgi:dTDP-4-dehydrorhamnose reductase
MLRLAAERPELRVVDDQTGCPTSAVDLAGAILTILTKAGQPGFDAWGTYHYRGGDIVTWYGFAGIIFEIAADLGVEPPKLNAITTDAHPALARRPAYSVLSTEKLGETFGIRSRPLRDSLRECLLQLLAPSG